MPRPRFVALYTDFGTTDVYAGVMRGVIRALAPEADVLDVTHGIARGDLFDAAFALLSGVPFLPRGTIHVCVVDPGVGTERRVVAVRAGGHTFIAPDNGLLAPVLDALGGVSDARTVSNERLLRPRRSATFHGRDVLAPLAAHLVRGIDFALVGEPATDLADLPGFAPDVGPAEALGRVLHVDRFGNLVTNLLPGELEGAAADWAFEIEGQRVVRRATTYGDVAPGELLVYTGSVGFLEVAVRDGDAAARLGARAGSAVRARRDGAS